MNDFEKLRANATEAAQLIRLMGNESRLMILCTLLDNEMTVTELNEVVPLSQSALSQHLATLRHAGLIVGRKEAQKIYYCVASEAPAKIIAVLKELYCSD